MIRTMIPRCRSLWWHPSLRGTTLRCRRGRWHFGRHLVHRIAVAPTWPHTAHLDVVRWKR
jgi:hypothetical protein